MNRRNFLATAGLGGAAIIVPFGITGCTQSQIDTAISDLPVAENTVDVIVTLVVQASGLGFISPTAVEVLNTVMGEVKVGLIAVGDDLSNYKNNPNPSVLDQIDTALSAVSSNLQSALTVGGIKDTATKATILGLVALIEGFVHLVQTIIPAAPTASAVRKSAQQKLKVASTIPTKEQFASLVNATLVLSRPEYQSLQITVK